MILTTILIALSLFKLNMDPQLALCSECGIIFPLKKHVKHQENITPCNICGNEFKTKKQMENHRYEHPSITHTGCQKQMPNNSRSSYVCGESSSFNCEQCPFESNKKFNLHRHVRVHK